MRKEMVWLVTGFCVLLVVANLVAMNAFSVSSFPLERSQTFDPEIRTDYREAISNRKPEIIILGDSSISQLREDVITSATGKETLVFSFPGTGSAYWYLFIRNQLFLADHRSEYFILFFRDSTLTVPEYRVSGEYFVRLEEVASHWDEDVYNLAINYKKPPFTLWLEKYVPIYAYRNEIYSQFIHASRNYFPGFFAQKSEDEVSAAFVQVFEREHINDQLWEHLLLNKDSLLYTSSALDFPGSVDRSFLPAMIRDIKMMGIKPVFVRVRYRSHARGEVDSAALQNYLLKLSAFFGKENVAYMDLSTENRITESMYQDNFHIQSSSSFAASKIIAERLSEVFN